jgi:hypothetical protein
MRCDIDVIAVEVPLGPDVIEIVREGDQGPEGLGVRLAQVAAVPIGGHKAVRAVVGGVAPASASDVSQANTIIGITRGAAGVGALADIAFGGEVEEPTWAWSLGPIYLGENGTLTQTPPSVGFVQRLGTALSPTKIAVLIGPATIKA